MANVPEFKQNFKYSNVGIVVGKLVYAKQLENEAGEAYGHEFLLNSPTTFGSVNVRVPKLEKSNYAMNNFHVADKPRVKLGLAQISQFTTDQGKTYTNMTSYLEMEEAKTVNGEDMADGVKGRVGGEVINLRMEGNVAKFSIVAHRTDKEGKLMKKNNGEPLKPDVVEFVVEDQDVLQSMQGLQNGSNIEVGYHYINKDDVTYDEFGFAQGTGNRIEKVVAKKIVRVQQNNNNDQNTGSFGQNQSNQNQNNQNGAFGTPLPQDDPLHQQAQDYFGGNNQNQGFSFGN